MYVVDTYALIEWMTERNDRYAHAFEKIALEGALISPLVLLEFYHKVLHARGQETAEQFLKAVLTQTKVVELSLDRIRKTGAKRSEMLKRRKKLSYADCLNLVVAEEFGAVVLTGDREFKDLRPVEFIE